MHSIRTELKLRGGQHAGQPLVRVGTTLLELAPLVSAPDRLHLLVIDGQTLLGVVSSEEVRERLQSVNPRERGRWEAAPIESLLTTPFTHVERPDSSPADAPTPPETIACLSHIAGDRVVAVSTDDDVLVSWRQLQPMLNRATTDPVTHLPRRSHFERALERALEHAARDRTSLAVILMDIDHFKRINDLCGHGLGDAVLHLVGRCLRRSLRSDDVAARFGGDEFVAICPGCRPDRMALPIRRLQQSIRQLCVPGDVAGLRITVSIGAAVAPEVDDTTRADSLLELADRSLYASKRNGRDCAHHVTIGRDANTPVLTSLDAPEEAWCDPGGTPAPSIAALLDHP
jgi:diguanylate cyclase (GGDEF)-like protein